MTVWKYEITVDGLKIHEDCGFESEKDAEDAAKQALLASDSCIDLYDIRVFQVWQELYYTVPTQVIFFEPEEQEHHAGIAYGKEVICGECGSTFELGEVEIKKEFENWIDIEEDIAGEELEEIEHDKVIDRWISIEDSHQEEAKKIRSMLP